MQAEGHGPPCLPLTVYFCKVPFGDVETHSPDTASWDGAGATCPRGGGRFSASGPAGNARVFTLVPDAEATAGRSLRKLFRAVLENAAGKVLIDGTP